ncbi:MAG: heparinase II/III family protein [Kiritimatiellae bacterium]|nr:heparinase II/III family protein [Kiritimatiellia bacterium]
MKAVYVLRKPICALFLAAACSGIQVAAKPFDYDSRFVLDFVASDCAASLQNVKADWGYYRQHKTHHGELRVADPAHPGIFVSAPYNACDATVDWTHVTWRGELGGGGLAISLRANVDDGRGRGVPKRDGWTPWLPLGANAARLEIPAALDGKSYVQCRLELTGGCTVCEVQIHKRVQLRDHPRLLLSPALVSRTRTRIAADRRIRDVYDRWLSALRKAAEDGAMQKNKNAWTLGWQMTAVGVGWQLSRESVFLNAQKRVLARMESDWAQGLGHFDRPALLGGAFVGLDMVFNDLTPEEQRRFGRALLTLADKQYATWRFSDLSNQAYVNAAKPMFAGLVLAGEGVDDEKALRYLRFAEDTLRLHLVPASNLWAADDGGWGEGHGYCHFTHGDFALETLAWSTATGEDLFQIANFFRFLSQWQVYETRPWSGYLAKFNDDKGQTSFGLPVPAFLAARYGDRHAQHLVQRKLGTCREKPWDFANIRLWHEVLWYDPDLPAEQPGYAERMPLGRHFEGVGHVVMRSGWNKHDTWAVFKSGRFKTPGAHQHADENSFVIDRKGPLAIDSGNYQGGTSHHDNYFTRTIAHDSITVFDPNEPFWKKRVNDGGQFGGTWLPYGGGKYDSAQYGAHLPGRELALDGITAFETNEHYTYACGDAARAYSRGKVSEFTRQFLFLRPQIFVVFDRITSTDPSFKKTWLLHTVNEPAIEGRTATVSADDGKLLVRTLLPADANVTKTGGPGKEFWVGGKNHPFPKKNAYELGAWRLEVSPAQSAKTDLFLHVLYVCDHAVDKMPEVALEESSEAVRLNVTDVAGAFAIAFAKTGPAGGHITMRSTGAGRTVLDGDLTQSVQPQRFDPGDIW